MSEGRNTELVSEMRGLSAYPGDAYDRAADALESTPRALREKEGELAAKDGHIRRLQDFNSRRELDVLEITRQRDEALAALKASEERGERLSQELASARLRPEPANVDAARLAAAKAICLAMGDDWEREGPGDVLMEAYGPLADAALSAAPQGRLPEHADATNNPPSDPGTEQREAGV